MKTAICVLVFLISGLPVHAQSREVANPASAGSGQPYLSMSSDGRIYLSWVEPYREGHRLQFAEWKGDGWKSTATAAEGLSWFVNWADYPTFLPLDRGAFVAHWLEKTSSSKYSYGIKVAQLAGPGSPWRTVFAPQVQKDGQYTGFASLVALPQGIGAAYLAPGTAGGEEDKSLRFVQFAKNGTVLSDELLDGDVCTCCQTAAALTAKGPIVAYRGHSADEIRDISIVAKRDEKWQRPHAVHRDGWRINACPVNGPALAANGMRVTAAWYTAAADSSRVYVAHSEDAGESFGEPVRVDGGMPLGRVAIALLPDSGAVASWIEKGPNGMATIQVRRIGADGRTSAAQTVASVEPARKTGFPKMVVVRDGLLFTWTADRIRTVVVPLPRL